MRARFGRGLTVVSKKGSLKFPHTSINNPLNPSGVGLVNFFGESQSRLYPHMRAKFGRGPTVVSKKGSLKFISRLLHCLHPHITPCWHGPPLVWINIIYIKKWNRRELYKDQLTTVAFSGTEAVYGRWRKCGGVSCTSITLMIKSVLLFKPSPSWRKTTHFKKFVHVYLHVFGFIYCAGMSLTADSLLYAHK